MSEGSTPAAGVGLQVMVSMVSIPAQNQVCEGCENTFTGKPLIDDIHCFGAFAARTTATDHKVQGAFSQFFYSGNPEVTEQPSSSSESG